MATSYFKLGAYGFILGTLDQADDPDGLPCTTHAEDLFFDYFIGTADQVCMYICV